MRSLLLALLALTVLADAQTIRFTALTEGVLQDRMRLAHPKVAERYKRLRELFEQTGCTNLSEQKVRGSKEPNLVCVVDGNGSSARSILVGAHFDCSGGDGLVDNWTGAILLPSLASFLREQTPRHSFKFVGFAAEEKGLLGSQAYLKQLGEDQRKQIAAVVTMDSLGLTPVKFWPNSSNEELARMGARLARSMKLDFQGVNVDRVGTTDSMTFHKAGIPVLSLHSVTQQTWESINSSSDVWTLLSWKDYYDTHRFVSALLTYFDQTLP
jgi:Zn-dependent M28 family amino/carboxypeptidase